MEKKQGYIITNGYIKSKKFDEITELYLEASKKCNMKLQSIRTDELTYGIAKNELFVQGMNKERIDYVLFLDKDIRLAKTLERQGIRLFNRASVIEECDDKSATFLRLANQGIKMPKTIIAPLVFPGTYKEEDQFIELIEESMSYPLIIKESFGSFGEQVYMVKNQNELRKKRKELAEKPHIYQEFIASSKGRDVRVNVVGEDVIASMERTSHTDFRANISHGGSMRPINLPSSFRELAIKVTKAIGADFAGVDLLFGQDGEPVLCEVNSNAHIKNILECTGISVADAIMEHIKREIKHD